MYYARYQVRGSLYLIIMILVFCASTSYAEEGVEIFESEPLKMETIKEDDPATTKIMKSLVGKFIGKGRQILVINTTDGGLEFWCRTKERDKANHYISTTVGCDVTFDLKASNGGYSLSGAFAKKIETDDASCKTARKICFEYKVKVLRKNKIFTIESEGRLLSGIDFSGPSPVVLKQF